METLRIAELAEAKMYYPISRISKLSSDWLIQDIVKNSMQILSFILISLRRESQNWSNEVRKDAKAMWKLKKFDRNERIFACENLPAFAFSAGCPNSGTWLPKF